MLKPGYIHAFPCIRTASVVDVSKYLSSRYLDDSTFGISIIMQNYWASGVLYDPREQEW